MARTRSGFAGRQGPSHPPLPLSHKRPRPQGPPRPAVVLKLVARGRGYPALQERAPVGDQRQEGAHRHEVVILTLQVRRGTAPRVASRVPHEPGVDGVEFHNPSAVRGTRMRWM